MCSKPKDNVIQIYFTYEMYCIHCIKKDVFRSQSF